jgi:DNA-binding NarL/FixJ family response regulator
MFPPLSVLIVDDDPLCSTMLRTKWLSAMPDSVVACRHEADVSGEFDVYLIDNNFHGHPLAVQLTRQARLGSPSSLIVVFSSDVDRKCLKGLLNAGCDAVAEKTNEEDLKMLLDLGRRYRQAREHQLAEDRPSRGRRSSLHAAAELLKQWNRRLELSKGLEGVRG